jgi:hypothetical protein
MPAHWLTGSEIGRFTTYPTEIPEADVVTFFTLAESDRRLRADFPGEANHLEFAL